MEFPINYINGNYCVTINEDGTKTRSTPDKKFEPKRPESIDINISNYCTNNCPFCFINASITGQHCDIEQFYKLNIPAYTEIALNYAKHPKLTELLHILKESKVITNITIHQKDFQQKTTILKQWQENQYIYGIGISFTDINETFLKSLIEFKNVVFHAIVGITPIKQVYKLLNDKNHKILFLGYKTKGRGVHCTPNIASYIDNMKNIINKNNIIGFDNLALKQLKIKQLVSIEEWEKCYMGKDGDFSFYIDAVKKKYYKSSTHKKGKKIKNKTIKEIYKNVKN